MRQHPAHDAHASSHTDYSASGVIVGHGPGDGHSGPSRHGLTRMAVSSTLHCLTGCAIGEIAGLIIGAAAGLESMTVIVISVSLAFLFGYLLSTLPLLKAGLGVPAAAGVVLAADTLSIVTMEIVDTLVMLAVPGATDAGLVNVVFWVSMALALLMAFAAAVPVNRYLLARGQGHALAHGPLGCSGGEQGWRRKIPAPATSTLVAAVAAFLLGGLVVSIADELRPPEASSRVPEEFGSHVDEVDDQAPVGTRG